MCSENLGNVAEMRHISEDVTWWPWLNHSLLLLKNNRFKLTVCYCSTEKFRQYFRPQLRENFGPKDWIFLKIYKKFLNFENKLIFHNFDKNEDIGKQSRKIAQIGGKILAKFCQKWKMFAKCCEHFVNSKFH